jgi:hypothetical protein
MGWIASNDHLICMTMTNHEDFIVEEISLLFLRGRQLVNFLLIHLPSWQFTRCEVTSLVNHTVSNFSRFEHIVFLDKPISRNQNNSGVILEELHTHYLIRGTLDFLRAFKEVRVENAKIFKIDTGQVLTTVAELHRMAILNIERPVLPNILL